MKLTLDSTSRLATKTLVEQGKLVKIEFYATTGDGFPQRVANFLQAVGDYTSGGASRTIGITDASSDEERAIKLFIDGDGADRIRDILIDGKKLG